MNYADLDPNIWRPVTFEGVTFPPTLMGISVLASIVSAVVPIQDDELHFWLHGLRTCCGITKRAPAEVCLSCAKRAMDLMIEHRSAVLAGIEECLGPYHFEPNSTFSDWISALQRISELAAACEDECAWSAPGYASDPLGTPEKRQKFMDILMNLKSKNS